VFTEYKDVLLAISSAVLLLNESLLAATPPIQTAANRFDVLFVAQIVNVRNPCDPRTAPLVKGLPSFEPCENSVRVRVTRILRDAGRLGLAPSVFDAVIVQQRRAISQPGPWTAQNVQAGQSYLVWSNEKIGPREMFELPMAVSIIRADQDDVADLELMLSVEKLTVNDQLSAVTQAIISTRQPHGPYLAEYVGNLLSLGDNANTVGLALAVDHGGELTFSETAKANLLGTLYQAVQHRSGNSDALRVFVTMTARYFARDDGDTVGSATHAAIVINYLP